MSAPDPAPISTPDIAPPTAPPVPTATTATALTREPSAEDLRHERRLAWVIVATLNVLIVMGISILIWVFHNENQAFNSAARAAQQSGLSIALVYLTTWQACALKFLSVTLSFLLIYAGTLFVLRAAAANYSLGAEARAGKAQFQTTSPGLALVTLGVIALTLALYKQVEISSGEVRQNNDASHQTLGVGSDPPRELVQFGEKK